MFEQPKVTVLIPCRNENRFISHIINSLQHQDYPEQLVEVFFLDGMSDDGTREIIKESCEFHSNYVILDNPNKTVPFALNLGIKNSTGNIIIRLDAHAIYPQNYISTLVYYLEKLGADNVGGIWETIPANDTLVAESIAIALSTPFGVGNATYRVVKNTNLEYIEVDTVPFGCYRRSVFEKYGLFDEQLTRNQDNEFNERIISGGGKIFLIPSLKIKYYARENYRKLFKMFYQYGYFGPLVDIKLKRFTRLRRYIPSLFILSLILPLFLSFLFSPMIYVAFLVATLYCLVLLGFSIYETYKRKKIIVMPFLIWAYLISHISYGFGYLMGFFDFYIFKKHKKRNLDVSLSR
ncbi:MAG TPA: glycosyltransferase family 2 protein [Bacteroidales bacterium]|nr:glycosyltransferase family 2 protein [Bacteroidales bacterium]